MKIQCITPCKYDGAELDVGCWYEVDGVVNHNDFTLHIISEGKRSNYNRIYFQNKEGKFNLKDG